MARDSNKYVRDLSVKFNLSFLGNPLFNRFGGYEQDKVLLLEDILTKCSLEDGKKIINQYAWLIHETWKYGFSEIIFNFLENNGIDRNGKIIQSDFGEITFNKNKVLENIKNKRWLKLTRFCKFPEGELKEHYRLTMEREITPKSLYSLWKINL